MLTRNILVITLGVFMLFIISCKDDGGKTIKQAAGVSSAGADVAVTITPTNMILPEKKVLPTIGEDGSNVFITPTARSLEPVINSKPIATPTREIVITPTAAVTESSGGRKAEPEVETLTSTDTKKDVVELLSEIETNMSAIESFSFNTSGTISFGTGGADVELPIISGGTIYNNISRSFFEVYFLGIPIIKSETYQSGSQLYSKSGPDDRWIESEKAGPGHISPVFWDEGAASMFDLTYKHVSGDSEFDVEGIFFLVTDDEVQSEITKLIELSFGSTEAILHDDKMESSAVLGISEDDHHLKILKATVGIEKGGKVLSQITGLPQLSSVGPVTIDLKIIFDKFGNAGPLGTDPNT